MSGAINTTTTPAGSSFVQRQLSLSIQLGKGNFGNAGFNPYSVSNLRMIATIQKLGFPAACRANIIVYGLPSDIMNQLTTLGVLLPMARDNTITIMAGDAVNGMAVVYKGTMQNAWQDLNAQPETFFNIEAWGGFLGAMAPVPPISFPGSADVATIMAGLATQLNLNFENSGVSVKLANPYLWGTAIDQAKKLARAADIEMYIDGQTLAIWPKTGTRKGATPVISPASGLINYPKFSYQGLDFRCLFNPNISFGGTIEMQSSLQPANGTWYVNKLNYSLASQLPGGPWFCEVGCSRVPGTPAA